MEVAPLASPPVCRIMDYGKFKFDAAQRAKESRRKASNVGIKEMKYRPKIGLGDFDTKTRQVVRFLDDGHKVKVTVMFRGREVFHPELGRRILDRIAERVDGTARVESEARLDGKNMVMVLAPDRRARQSSAAKAQHEAEGAPEAPSTNGAVPGGTTGPPTAGAGVAGGAVPGPVANGSAQAASGPRDAASGPAEANGAADRAGGASEPPATSAPSAGTED